MRKGRKRNTDLYQKTELLNHINKSGYTLHAIADAAQLNRSTFYFCVRMGSATAQQAAKILDGINKLDAQVVRNE